MTKPVTPDDKKWKRILTNIYTSGLEKNTDLETLRKVALLNVLFTIGLLMLIPFGILAYLGGRILIGLADHLVAVVVIFSLFHMRRKRTYALATYACTAMAILLFLLVFIQGSVDHSGPLWSLTLPVFTLFAFGLKRGTAASLLYLMLLGLLIVFSPPVLSPVSYSLNFLLRYLGAFVIIFAISFFFEATRAKTRSAFDEKEAALQDSERKYREMADLLPQPIFETNLRGKVTFLSHSGYYLSGYTKEDLKKQLSAQDIFIPEDRRRLRENNQRVLSGEKIGGIEYTIRRKDGSTFPVILHSTPILKNDRAVGARGVIIDISPTKEAEREKHELEKKLAHAEKMEAIGRLAGSVAHDLNNILGAIVGYPDLILLNLPKNSNLAKPVRAMKESGQKAAAIVQDLLTLARRGVTSDEVLDLNAIVKDYVRSPEFEKMLNIHTGVKVETDLDRNLLKIKGSALQLSKSLMNMVSNAAEAMPDGGRITIATRNQNLEDPEQGYDSLILPGDYTVLTIKDEGVGIPDNILKNIFEPFFTKKTMGRSGTGLGMSVVWGSVADHNGKITVASTQGEGTTFDLYFPITREDIPPEKVEKQFKEFLGRRERILVVDDIEEQQNIADSLLTKLGYRVDRVSSGEAAIEYFSRRSPDLVILDMIMPQGIDGLDTYREIHKIKPDTRVIITSGFSETERVKAAQELGAGPYLRKPYTLEAIGAVVRQELDHKKS